MKTVITACLLAGWVAFWIGAALFTSKNAGLGVAMLLVPTAFLGVLTGVSFKDDRL